MNSLSFGKWLWQRAFVDRSSMASPAFRVPLESSTIRSDRKRGICPLRPWGYLSHTSTALHSSLLPTLASSSQRRGHLYLGLNNLPVVWVGAQQLEEGSRQPTTFITYAR